MKNTNDNHKQNFDTKKNISKIICTPFNCVVATIQKIYEAPTKKINNFEFNEGLIHANKTVAAIKANQINNQRILKMKKDVNESARGYWT
jgi:hypothetical protein